MEAKSNFLLKAINVSFVSYYETSLSDLFNINFLLNNLIRRALFNEIGVFHELSPDKLKYPCLFPKDLFQFRNILLQLLHPGGFTGTYTIG